MNDVQLRSFTAAVELGSFNKAAKGQFLSVPSFAQRINSLEAELGYRILERGPSGVRPTDAGLVLYRAAKEALDILDKAREEGRSVAEEQPAERVTIGVWWQVHPFMMEAVRQMAQTHPRLKIDFVETSYGDAAEGFAPELHEFESFFARDNVVKESIFREKLTMDCLRGDAVSFFNHSNISKICPPLEARPMEWPPLAYGAHVRPGAPRVVRDVLDACIDSFKRTG